MDKSFNISVIIPVYQVEYYLEEAILSILNQTLGFSDYIQMILVNDGTKDKSANICKKYQIKYPDNIIYIEQENAGVSSARNKGLQKANGEWITFLDGDDKWDEKAFEYFWKFQENNQDIDIIVARDRYFEAETKFHILDYKFKNGSRIVDINKEEELFSVQSRLSVFIKRVVLKEKFFCEKLKYGEDSLFVNSIILQKGKYGLVKEAIYYYRKRFSESSAMQKQKNDMEYYINTCRQYHVELFRLSEMMYGFIIPYVQSVVYYDLGGRLKTENYKEIMSVSDQKIYLDILKKIFIQIEDEIIMRNPVHKAFFVKRVAYNLKYNQDLYHSVYLSADRSKLLYKSLQILDLANNTNSCYLDSIDVVDNGIYIEGRVSRWLMIAIDGKFELEINEKRFLPNITLCYDDIYNTMFGEEQLFMNSSCLVYSNEYLKEQFLRIKPVLNSVHGKCIYAWNAGKNIFLQNGKNVFRITNGGLGLIDRKEVLIYPQKVGKIKEKFYIKRFDSKKKAKF